MNNIKYIFFCSLNLFLLVNNLKSIDNIDLYREHNKHYKVLNIDYKFFQVLNVGKYLEHIVKNLKNINIDSLNKVFDFIKSESIFKKFNTDNSKNYQYHLDLIENFRKLFIQFSKIEKDDSSKIFTLKKMMNLANEIKELFSNNDYDHIMFQYGYLPDAGKEKKVDKNNFEELFLSYIFPELKKYSGSFKNIVGPREISDYLYKDIYIYNFLWSIYFLINDNKDNLILKMNNTELEFVLTYYYNFLKLEKRLNFILLDRKYYIFKGIENQLNKNVENTENIDNTNCGKEFAKNKIENNFVEIIYQQYLNELNPSFINKNMAIDILSRRSKILELFMDEKNSSLMIKIRKSYTKLKELKKKLENMKIEDLENKLDNSKNMNLSYFKLIFKELKNKSSGVMQYFLGKNIVNPLKNSILNLFSEENQQVIENFVLNGTLLSQLINFSGNFGLGNNNDLYNSFRNTFSLTKEKTIYDDAASKVIDYLKVTDKDIKKNFFSKIDLEKILDGPLKDKIDVSIHHKDNKDERINLIYKKILEYNKKNWLGKNLDYLLGVSVINQYISPLVPLIPFKTLQNYDFKYPESKNLESEISSIFNNLNTYWDEFAFLFPKDEKQKIQNRRMFAYFLQKKFSKVDDLEKMDSFSDIQFKFFLSIYSIYIIYSRVNAIIGLYDYAKNQIDDIKKMFILQDYIQTLKKLFQETNNITSLLTELYSKNNIEKANTIPELIIYNDIKENSNNLISNIDKNLEKIRLIQTSAIFMDSIIAKFYSDNIKNNYNSFALNNLFGAIALSFEKIKLLKDEKYKFSCPKMIHNSEDTKIIFKNMWFPGLVRKYNMSEPVYNSMNLENNSKNVMIVGPIGSGKTVFISNLMSVLYLSNLGIVPAEYFEYTYFNEIIDNSNPQYNLGEGSRHIEEMTQMNKSIEKMYENDKKPKNEKEFIVIFTDEIYSATSEDISYYELSTVLPPLFKNKNVMSIITTHNINNIAFCNDKDLNTGLYYAEILRTNDEFERTYKIIADDVNNWWARKKPFNNIEIKKEYVKWMQKKYSLEAIKSL